MGRGNFERSIKIMNAARDLIAATAGMNQCQRARLLDRAIGVLSYNHKHAQGMGVRTTIEILLAQIALEAQQLRNKTQTDGETNKVPQTKPMAPVVYLGEMGGTHGCPIIELWNLTEDIKGFPKHSTLSRALLESEGYQMPERKL